MNAIFRILNDYSFTRLVFFLTKIIYFSYQLNNRKIHSCPESIDVLARESYLFILPSAIDKLLHIYIL